MIHVLLVTNIMTPYRDVLYNACGEIAQQKGIEWHTSFMARGEAIRRWRGEDYYLNHPHHFHAGLDLPVPGRAIATHINPGIWWSQLTGHWDVVIVGGYDHFTSAVCGWLPGPAVKLLWSESSMVGPRPRGSLSEAVKRALICRYDGYVVPGQRAKDYICSVRPAAKQSPFLLLPCVVNEALYRGVRQWSLEERVAARRRWAIDVDERVIVAVARQDENKGLHRVLAALAGAVDGPLTVVVVGDGPMMEEVTRQAAVARPIRVKLVGYQEQGAVAELLGLADAFLLASLWDAGPMAMVEAAMTGLPIISTDRAGFCAELVKPHWNGWQFDPICHESIRGAVNAFLRTPDEDLAVMASRSAELADGTFRIVPGVAQFMDGLVEFVQHGRPSSGTLG